MHLHVLYVKQVLKRVDPINSSAVDEPCKKLSLIISPIRHATNWDPPKTNYSVDILMIYSFLICDHGNRAIL